MRRKISIYMATITSSLPIIPTCYADSITSVEYILLICSALLTVFRNAGILLLVYGVIALILSMKDENPESKVNAISKIAVAITLITLGTIINGLLTAAGVSGSIT